MGFKDINNNNFIVPLNKRSTLFETEVYSWKLYKIIAFSLYERLYW